MPFYPQQCIEIAQVTAGTRAVLVFVGGFGDYFTGLTLRAGHKILKSGVLGDPEQFLTSYYHWNGGGVTVFQDKVATISPDILALRHHAPHLPIVLVGHSYGGSACMHVARLLHEQSTDLPPHKLFLLTADPVSRRQSKTRAPGLDYWVNTYIQHGRTPHDLLPKLGGHWQHCPDADTNICYHGTEFTSHGTRHGHANLLGLLGFELPFPHGSPLHILKNCLIPFLRITC